MIQTIKIVWFLIIKRKQYDFVFIWNFDLPFYLSALLIKILLRKKIVVDFEDDYTLIRKSKIKNIISKLLYKTADKIVCINEHMKMHFPNKPVCVINTCVDLSYASQIEFQFKQGMTILFSSKLDEIRGADLIGEFITALKSKVEGFKLIVTGLGPLADSVKKLSFSELDYRGYVADDVLEELTMKADACLVLQKPDSPFSKGSFPSKIEEYAKFMKPIIVLY